MQETQVTSLQAMLLHITLSFSFPCVCTTPSQSGGLAVVEAVEERWTALWGAYEALDRSPDTQGERERGSMGGDGSLGGGGGGGGRDSSSTPPPVVDSLRARLVDATGGGEVDSFARHIGRNLGLGSGNPLLEAASAIGLFSPFGAPQLASRSTGSHTRFSNTLLISHTLTLLTTLLIPLFYHTLHNTLSHTSHNPP